MNTLVPLLIATAFIALFSALAIWIVGYLDFGLEVDGFGTALFAGIVIAFVAGIISVLLDLAGIADGDGLIGGIVYLLVAIVTLLAAGRLLPRLKVNGIGGASVTVVAIGLFYWLGGLLIGQII